MLGVRRQTPTLAIYADTFGKTANADSEILGSSYIAPNNNTLENAHTFLLGSDSIGTEN